MLYYKQAQFFDAQHGWILAGTAYGGAFNLLYHTRDGGTTWSPPDTIQTFDPALGGLLPGSAGDLVFVNPARGVGVGYSELYTTLDSGRTWARQPFGFHNFSRPGAARLRAAPDGSVWLVEAKTAQVWRTRALGQPWQLTTITRTLELPKFSQHLSPRPPQFLDARHGWAMVLEDTALLRTTDRGVHWQRVPLPRPTSAGTRGAQPTVEDFDFIDPDTGFACVASPTPLTLLSYWLQRTTDAGRTWTTTALPLSFGLSIGSNTRVGIDFVSARRGAVVTTHGTILMTQDGGQTWLSPPSGTTRDLVRVSWRDSLTAYATGSTTTGDSAVLVRTTNGGLTWSRLPNSSSFFGGGAAFLAAPGGLLWGDGIYTRDEGLTKAWFTVDTMTNYFPGGGGAPATGNLITVSFRDARHGLAFGIYDYYRTHDGGQSWQRFASPGSYTSSAPYFGSAVDDYNPWTMTRNTHLLHYSEKYVQTDTSATQLTAYCTGDTLTVAFDTVGIFSSAERDFRLELSNKMGRFRPHETTLLPLLGATTTSPLRAVLPARLAAGTRYRLRVIRADSSVLGGDNARDLTISSRPAQPVITLAAQPSGLVILTSSFPTGNQWFLNGQPINGATGPTYTVSTSTQSGRYTVQVAQGGCTSPLSTAQNVTVLGFVREAGGRAVRVAPNPARGWALVTSEGAALLSVTLTDLAGRTVGQVASQGRLAVSVPLTDIPGVFTCSAPSSSTGGHQ